MLSKKVNLTIVVQIIKEVIGINVISPHMIDTLYNQLCSRETIIAEDITPNQPKLLRYEDLSYKGKKALYDIFDPNINKQNFKKPNSIQMQGAKIIKPQEAKLCLKCYGAYNVDTCGDCGKVFSVAHMHMAKNPARLFNPWSANLGSFFWTPSRLCSSCCVKRFNKPLELRYFVFHDGFGGYNLFDMHPYPSKSQYPVEVCQSGGIGAVSNPVSRPAMLDAILGIVDLDNIPDVAPINHLPRTTKESFKRYVKKFVKHNLSGLCAELEKITSVKSLAPEEKVVEINRNRSKYTVFLVFPAKTNVNVSEVEDLVEKYVNIKNIENHFNIAGAWCGTYIEDNGEQESWEGKASLRYSDLSVDLNDDFLTVVFEAYCDIEIK